MKPLYTFLTVFTFLFMVTSVNAAEQKAVLVTGATSGIGLRITEHLSNQGYFVYAGARKDADMARLNKMNNVMAVRLDVNKPEQITAAVDTISKQGRGLWGLVNNAGVVELAPLIEMEEKDFNFQMQVNVYGPFRISKAFAPLIIESQGRITTISSISGILSGRLFGGYSMTKHAMEAFADSLAAEMHSLGVQVSVIEPGNFESKIGNSFVKRFEKRGIDINQSLFKKDYEAMLGYMENRTTAGDPIKVAKAVEHALFAEHPKMRYMVTPNQRETDITLRKAAMELVELNQQHEYSLTEEQLTELVKAAFQSKQTAPSETK